MIALFIILENAVLNYVLINQYNVLGAAFASLLSFMTLAGAFLLISIRCDPMLLLVLHDSINKIVVLIGTLMVISAVTVSLYFPQDVKTVVSFDIVGLLVSYSIFHASRKKGSL